MLYKQPDMQFIRSCPSPAWVSHVGITLVGNITACSFHLCCRYTGRAGLTCCDCNPAQYGNSNLQIILAGQLSHVVIATLHSMPTVLTDYTGRTVLTCCDCNPAQYGNSYFQTFTGRTGLTGCDCNPASITTRTLLRSSTLDKHIEASAAAANCQCLAIHAKLTLSKNSGTVSTAQAAHSSGQSLLSKDNCSVSRLYRQG
jgi:hypothetical protein